MKLALYLLVLLTGAFGTPQENQQSRTYVGFERDPKVETCHAKCTDDEKKIFYICTDADPFPYDSRCNFKCSPDGHKEIECEPDSIAACMNNMCTPDERRYDRGTFCDENGLKAPSECNAKCLDSNYKNNAVKPCKD